MGEAVRVRLGIVLLLILAAVIGVELDVQGPLRVAAVLPFLFVGPGIAWVSITERLGVGGYTVVAVSVSVAFSILVATLLLFTQLWSPDLGFWLLVFATAVGLFVTDT
jgi:hypothetical protein